MRVRNQKKTLCVIPKIGTRLTKKVRTFLRNWIPLTCLGAGEGKRYFFIDGYTSVGE